MSKRETTILERSTTFASREISRFLRENKRYLDSSGWAAVDKYVFETFSSSVIGLRDLLIEKTAPVEQKKKKKEEGKHHCAWKSCSKLFTRTAENPVYCPACTKRIKGLDK